MATLTLDHATKKFGEVTAANDICIEVKDKEFLVLVGPSGCGKSTTLRLIAGLEEITSGNIYIGDRLVNDVAPKDRDIAMVFQSYALYPHMSVYDNLAFGLKLRKTPKKEIDRRVHEAAEILGISVDNVWSHKAFAAARKIDFPLLADFEPKGAVSKAYGAYRAEAGTSARALYVIDKEGIVRWSYRSPNGVNPGADGILAALEELAAAKG